tara:strand:+ start:250 stop:1152 length:903 start_codon:yes stop_codon:yes gene_type:complete
MFKKRENKNIIDSYSAEEANKAMKKDGLLELASTNNSNTASYDQIKHKIKPGDSSHIVSSKFKKKDHVQQGAGTSFDNSASFSAYHSQMDNEGFSPRQVEKDGHMDNFVLDDQGNPVIDYSNLSKGMHERSFYNKYGENIDNHFTKGVDLTYTDHETGSLVDYSEFNLGPYQFHTDSDGNFIDQNGKMWDKDIIRNAWGNLQKVSNNVMDAKSPQEAWEAHMPLAMGDTPEGKAANANQTFTFNPETGVYEGTEIYVGSGEDYLTRRSDINHELNRPKPNNEPQTLLAKALGNVKGLWSK